MSSIGWILEKRDWSGSGLRTAVGAIPSLVAVTPPFGVGRVGRLASSIVVAVFDAGFGL